ncbi:MAG: ankyrin repeat domain-containing protein [Chthonomonadales bacterium]
MKLGYNGISFVAERYRVDREDDMRKKMNRTRVIILIVAALTVEVPSLIVYSYYDRARKSEQLLPAITSGNTDKAIWLLKSGADANYVGPYGARRVAAIEAACNFRNPVVVRYLLSHGVKGWIVGEDKASLIRSTVERSDIASPEKCNEIMQMLIDHGADVNAVNTYHFAPILVAVVWEENDAVKFLINHGANVNVTTTTGISPLLTATDTGKTYAVRLLLNAGADLSKCGTTFEKLIALAQEYDYKETVAILKDAMAKRRTSASSTKK